MRRGSVEMPLLLDTETTAVALGITPSGVRKLRQRGRLKNRGTKRRALHAWEDVCALIPGLQAVKRNPKEFREIA